MTYIPRKDEYNNQQAQQQRSKSTGKKVDWARVIEESRIEEAFLTLCFLGAFWLHLLTMGSESCWHSLDGLKYFCDAIVLIVLGTNVLNYFTEKGFSGFIVDIIYAIGGTFCDVFSRIDPDEVKKSAEEDIRKYNERVEQSKKDSGYYESLKKPEDTRDFNTKQRDERRARAYAKADPEFEVSYKSKGGCWVRDIVRGRDKAEILNRYRKNPMVEYMGGVVGIDE